MNKDDEPRVGVEDLVACCLAFYNDGRPGPRVELRQVTQVNYRLGRSLLPESLVADVAGESGEGNDLRLRFKSQRLDSHRHCRRKGEPCGRTS